MIKTGGNPIPTIGFGPLHLPRPDQMPLDPRPRFAVAHYLTEPTIYRKWFFPQLDNAFGPLWPLILIIAVAAALYIAWRSRNIILRVIAVAALLTAAVYVFTPLTAAGQEGSPTGFFTNTRYLVPGLVLALTLLPIARPLRAPDRRAWQTLLFLTVVYAITVLTTPRWYPGFIVGTLFLTLALVWAPAGLGLARSRRIVSRALVVGVGGAVLLLAVVLGRAQEVQYYKHHYTRTTLFLQDGGPQKAYAFAHNQHDKRIGIAGSGEIFFGQYGFYGANLDNDVQYIGVPGADGTYRLATSCPQFRRRINAGNYDYLILSRFTQDSIDAPYWYPIYRWIRSDPALKLIIEEPDITPEADYVFKVNGKLDPAGCPRGR
jgi:4-amino-4-deoxy-L-arabinose transferase-like glycosyltransferase